MDKVEANVLQWLTAGSDDAVDIVDLPWKVEELDRGVYYAEHPSVPMHLMVAFSDNFVHLIVPTTIETAEMSNEEKLRIYETLMWLNDKVHMMKYSIGGENKNIRLRVDLDKSTLGKEEFNNALVALVIGVLVGVKALGIEMEFMQKVLQRLIDMLVYRIENGATEEELMNFLTNTVGMDVRDAKDLLDAVMQAIEQE
ncbi:hypothetical protein [Candidatus Aciduliprofundum boonei]|uniref:Uncharacterized protein n=1 Tax=Aciduliprofundum boonei (strain DSM 19572 / T469) TaxID=439481 RepID=B5IDM9_ACIB4|nr:hypothetical protein [Candidatus Aciduliprofundum boonei]ADD08101.1 conserved hypothetical protein [Aciduliprofundum boonei T469]EDY35581.1 hypothetical protein ABOONEI_118 [Aciduliprofundum boonei T469]HII55057.1 DNA-binding protein [Candidatus Aciduliprofundum boonei]